MMPMWKMVDVFSMSGLPREFGLERGDLGKHPIGISRTTANMDAVTIQIAIEQKVVFTPSWNNDIESHGFDR